MQMSASNNFTARRETEIVVHAIAELLDGIRNGDPRATEALMSTFGQLSTSPQLTKRACEVLTLLLEDKCAEEICNEMWITPSTLRDYKLAIRRAYETRSIEDALDMARKERNVILG